MIFDITNVFYYGCVTLEKIKFFVIFYLNGVFFYYWKIKENHYILIIYYSLFKSLE